MAPMCIMEMVPLGIMVVKEVEMSIFVTWEGCPEATVFTGHGRERGAEGKNQDHVVLAPPGGEKDKPNNVKLCHKQNHPKGSALSCLSRFGVS